MGDENGAEPATRPAKDFKGILLSPPIDCLVGPRERKFTIPSRLICDISPALNASINNGKMKESRNGCVYFEDIDDDLFTALCEFAYRQDYRAPEPPYDNEGAECDDIVADVEDSIDTGHGLGIEREDLVIAFMRGRGLGDWHGFTNGHQDSRPVEAGTRQYQINEEFAKLEYCDELLFKDTPRNLLFHAKLYAFAEEKLITTLQRRCLQRIHCELKEIVPEDGHDLEFLSLLHFAYADLERQGHDGDCQLRRLVIHYATTKLDFLLQLGGFMAMLDSFPEMASDLVRCIFTK